MQKSAFKVGGLKESRSKDGSLDRLRSRLKKGHVYRREDFLDYSNAVDRHLKQLLDLGDLEKLAPGLYYAPKISTFGKLPPKDEELVRVFLKDDDFLLLSPNSYNSLGWGSTQLYNKTLVYNHKRHGIFQLGSRVFDFRMKPRYPKKLDREFLFVDALNNLDSLAEDSVDLLVQARRRLPDFETVRLQKALNAYGAVKTKKTVQAWFSDVGEIRL